MAAAEAVLNRQQKESGTLVLDIGASTTNMAILEDGEIQHVAVIPVGGMNITNDLAIGLRIDLDLAEEVKIKQANLKVDRQKSWESEVKFKGEIFTFPSTEIQMIIEARIEELLEFVDEELSKVGKSKKLPGGVVIVGGTSKIPGIDTFTRDKLQLPSRLGKIEKLHGLVDSANDPSYSTAVGLMMLDMLLGGSQSYENGKHKSGPNLTSITNKLLNKIKRPKNT